VCLKFGRVGISSLGRPPSARIWKRAHLLFSTFSTPLLTSHPFQPQTSLLQLHLRLSENLTIVRPDKPHSTHNSCIIAPRVRITLAKIPIPIPPSLLIQPSRIKMRHRHATKILHRLSHTAPLFRRKPFSTDAIHPHSSPPPQPRCRNIKLHVAKSTVRSRRARLLHFS
jgi:hypothetical protein